MKKQKEEKKKEDKLVVWSPLGLLNTGADYMVSYGERSNGKTTGCEAVMLEDYIDSGYINQCCIIRRWEEDFKNNNGQQMWEVFNNGWIDRYGKHHTIKEYTNGRYNLIRYWARKWYLVRMGEDGKIEEQDDKPFCYGFGITSEEHYKSTSYPNINWALFDEFITRDYYVPNEFVKFQNLLSTIIRKRDNVKIFMCGNTINQYCPYFKEMGLTGIGKQKQGTIDVYSYGDTELKVAVEYSTIDKTNKKAIASNKYFAFNNPKLKMITNGNWEMDIYPHLPCDYDVSEVKYIFYILFEEQLLQCEIISSRKIKSIFVFIHRKTTPIKEDNKNLVFQQENDVRMNYRRKLNVCFDDIGKKIWSLFVKEQVFYQDNEVGEVIRNYLIWCKKEGN